jgi:hypothetical protein
VGAKDSQGNEDMSKARPKSGNRPKRKAKPLGFLSYAQFDDLHNRGWISKFARVLSGEIHAQTGDPFDLFQDRNDVLWGENWRERINSSLKAATFLFPIVTPTFLKSKECRREFQDFLHFEHKSGQKHLILPVYYIKCREVEDHTLKTVGVIVRDLRARQRWDWTALRFAALVDLKVRKVLSQMGERVHDAIEENSSHF